MTNTHKIAARHKVFDQRQLRSGHRRLALPLTCSKTLDKVSLSIPGAEDFGCPRCSRQISEATKCPITQCEKPRLGRVEAGRSGSSQAFPFGVHVFTQGVQLPPQATKPTAMSGLHGDLNFILERTGESEPGKTQWQEGGTPSGCSLSFPRWGCWAGCCLV